MIEPSIDDIHLAAQCWCDEKTSHMTLEPALAMAFAQRIAEQRSALETRFFEHCPRCHGLGGIAAYREAKAEVVRLTEQLGALRERHEITEREVARLNHLLTERFAEALATYLAERTILDKLPPT